MTLIELQYLVTLAQELHFGRAAARCYVSQPNLSMAVRKLENDLDVCLFERSKVGITVTTLGAQIIAQAERVLTQTAALKAIAEAGKDQLSGILKLGTLSTLSPYLAPSLIPQMRLMANKMCLHIEEATSTNLHHKLSAGELDAILVSQPCTGGDILSQPLFEEPLVVVLNSKHPLAAKKVVHLHDLSDHELLLLDENHCLRQQVLAIFVSLTTESQPTFSTMSSLETLRHMVAANLGITVLPLSAATSALYTNNVIVTRKFFAPEPTRTLTLAWRASFPRHKAIDLLRRAVQICTWQFTTAHDSSSQSLLVENNNW